MLLLKLKNILILIIYLSNKFKYEYLNLLENVLTDNKNCTIKHILRKMRFSLENIKHKPLQVKELDRTIRMEDHSKYCKLIFICYFKNFNNI